MRRKKIGRFKPISAMIALLAVTRDPQNTKMVGRLMHATRSDSEIAVYLRFKSSAACAKALAGRRELSAALDDTVALASLPEGSLGRHLLAFMQAAGFSAQGLAEQISDSTAEFSDASPKARLFANRVRDLHDVYHILNGCGRDEVGELYVLAFSYAQLRITALAAVSIATAIALLFRLPRHGIMPHRVLPALIEAFQNGHHATWLPGEDIEAMLPLDLNIIRQTLNIRPAPNYQALMRALSTRTGWSSGPVFAPPGT